MFEQPKTGNFTQGTVFTCAHAENYPSEKVYGLVITARCDAAQDKVPVFTYVPMIPLTTWVLRDGATLILERARAENLNNFSNLLKERSLSNSLLRTHSLDSIFETHFRPLESDRNQSKYSSKFAKYLEQHKCLEDLARNIRNSEIIKAGLGPYVKLIDNIIKELSHSKLSGYYLVRGVKTLDEYNNGDFVVLLREVHHIPNQTAKLIADGIAPIDWKNKLSQNSGLNSVCPKFIDDEDFALPLGRVSSPWIEHIMQSFSMLFARIGVKDIDHEDVRKSLDKIGLGV